MTMEYVKSTLWAIFFTGTLIILIASIAVVVVEYKHHTIEERIQQDQWHGY